VLDYCLLTIDARGYGSLRSHAFAGTTDIGEHML
jgi:hypothetical protein